MRQAECGREVAKRAKIPHYENGNYQRKKPHFLPFSGFFRHKNIRVPENAHKTRRLCHIRQSRRIRVFGFDFLLLSAVLSEHDEAENDKRNES